MTVGDLKMLDVLLDICRLHKIRIELDGERLEGWLFYA